MTARELPTNPGFLSIANSAQEKCKKYSFHQRFEYLYHISFRIISGLLWFFSYTFFTNIKQLHSFFFCWHLTKGHGTNYIATSYVFSPKSYRSKATLLRYPWDLSCYGPLSPILQRLIIFNTIITKLRNRMHGKCLLISTFSYAKVIDTPAITYRAKTTPNLIPSDRRLPQIGF